MRRLQANAIRGFFDYKCISFQFWKEGIARYTEYQVAQTAASKFRASKEFIAQKDYRSFQNTARTTYEGILKQLGTQQLGESKTRSCLFMIY